MNDKGEFAVLSRAVLTHAPHLSACVFVLLDWDAPRQKLVNETRALGLPVRILVLDETLPSPALDESAHLRRLHPAHLPEGLAAL